MPLLFWVSHGHKLVSGIWSQGIPVFQETRRVTKLLSRVLGSPRHYVSIPSCPGEAYRLTVGKVRWLRPSFPPFGVVVSGDRCLRGFPQAGRVPACAGCFPRPVAGIAFWG